MQWLSLAVTQTKMQLFEDIRITPHLERFEEFASIFWRPFPRQHSLMAIIYYDLYGHFKIAGSYIKKEFKKKQVNVVELSPIHVRVNHSYRKYHSMKFSYFCLNLEASLF